MPRGVKVETSVAPVLCPDHKLTMVQAEDPLWRGRLLCCPIRDCQQSHVLPAVRRQMKLPGMDPGRQSNRVDVSEAALQRQVVQWGRLMGYVVMQVGQFFRYVTCPACRYAFRTLRCPQCQETFAPSIKTTNDPGVPDTIWTRPSWNGMMKGIELKKNSTADIRPEQRTFIEMGVIDVAWSLEQVQDIVRKANEEREARKRVGDTRSPFKRE